MKKITHKQLASLMKGLFFILFTLIQTQAFAQCVDPLDCDGDGIANATNLDDDNDGILGIVECSPPSNPSRLKVSPYAPVLETFQYPVGTVVSRLVRQKYKTK